MMKLTPAIVLLLASTALADVPPPPYAQTFDLSLTVPDYPYIDGAYGFEYRPDPIDGFNYFHFGNGANSWGQIDYHEGWTLPYESGGFLYVPMGDGEPLFVDFTGTFLADGNYRVDWWSPPSVTLSGPGNVPEPAGLLACALIVAGARSRVLRRTLRAVPVPRPGRPVYSRGASQQPPRVSSVRALSSV